MKRITDGDLNLYETDGLWSVADRAGWLPGSYDSEATARKAATLDSAVLDSLQELKNAERGGFDGVITMADLPA